MALIRTAATAVLILVPVSAWLQGSPGRGAGTADVAVVARRVPGGIQPEAVVDERCAPPSKLPGERRRRRSTCARPIWARRFRAAAGQQPAGQRDCDRRSRRPAGPSARGWNAYSAGRAPRPPARPQGRRWPPKRRRFSYSTLDCRWEPAEPQRNRAPTFIRRPARSRPFLAPSTPPSTATGTASRGEDHRKVWLARSQDDGATFAEAASVRDTPTGACSCCQTPPGARCGGLALLYRSATNLTAATSVRPPRDAAELRRVAR